MMNEDMKQYRHLRKRDRTRISRMKSWGYSLSKIALKTGFSKSTISRELKRNGEIVDRDMKFWKKLYFDLELTEDLERIKNLPDHEKFLRYQTHCAEQRAAERAARATKRSKISPELRFWVISELKRGRTPEQIAGRSKREFSKGLSHESVYKIVADDKKTGGKLYRKLPRFRKRKQRLGNRTYTREIIPNRIGIEKRPPIVEKRSRLGDLEGDLIVGKSHKSFLLTMVDRCSRQVAIEYLSSRNKAAVRAGFLKAIKKMPAAFTLTLDNAKEFSCHNELSIATGVEIFFANPYASHERGTVENTNGLIRRTFPKKTDFRRVSKQRIRELERKLNSTPRKVLGYLTSEEFVSKQTL